MTRFNPFTRTIAIVLEVVGCCIISAGMAIEITTGAEIGYIAITGGALAIAFGGMIFAKLYRVNKGGK